MSAPDALRIVVTADCPHCRAPQAIHRLEPRALCVACGRERPIEDGTWARLLREAIVAAPGLRPGITRSARAAGLTLQYRRIELACLGCGGAVDLADERCAPCGRPVRARALRDTPYGAEVPALSHVFGESPARGFGEGAETLPCDGCGAALPLEGDRSGCGPSRRWWCSRRRPRGSGSTRACSI